jgi:hypothetical protein
VPIGSRPTGHGHHRRSTRRGAHQRRPHSVHDPGGPVPLLRNAHLPDRGADGGSLHRRHGRQPGDQRLRLLQHRSGARPLASGITPAERAARAANYITGTAYPDPNWTGKLSISKQHDQGVVVLDAPAITKWPGITPAPLLPVGTLDVNQGALKNETFVLVGYGVEIGAKKAQLVIRERRFTTSFLKNVQSEVVTFQINDRDSKAGGGSCFGDSGGPAFLGQYVVGDSSFVNSLSCNATAGYQRVDTPYARAFLEQFI